MNISSVSLSNLSYTPWDSLSSTSSTSSIWTNSDTQLSSQDSFKSLLSELTVATDEAKKSNEDSYQISADGAAAVEKEKNGSSQDSVDLLEKGNETANADYLAQAQAAMAAYQAALTKE